jgi:hypothetical protein
MAYTWKKDDDDDDDDVLILAKYRDRGEASNEDRSSYGNVLAGRACRIPQGR